MPPAHDYTQHQMQLQDHGLRLGHVEERVEVHDRTIFGFNGKEPGMAARLQGIENAAVEYRKNRFLMICTLLTCVIEGGIAIGIAAFK